MNGFCSSSVLIAALLLLAGCDTQKDETGIPVPKAAVTLHQAQKIQDSRLENAHRLTGKVFTGAEPHGEAAFKALKDLGVKTVISVDGAKPDLEAAHKCGLTYVHLPIGYDGVSSERSKELAKAIEDLAGPVYIHCHHGKHRGPAAAATACVVAGELSNDEAVAAMKVLGTGETYLGLWASAREAKPATPQELKDLKVKFHEVSPIPPLAEAMVHVDVGFDYLTDLKIAGWRPIKEQPDLDPPHEALKLREIFTEIMRTEDFKARPDDFKKWMKSAENLATKLEQDLLKRKADHYEGEAPQAISAAYEALKANCSTCHKPYRNAPK